MKSCFGLKLLICSVLSLTPRHRRSVQTHGCNELRLLCPGLTRLRRFTRGRWGSEGIPNCIGINGRPPGTSKPRDPFAVGSSASLRPMCNLWPCWHCNGHGGERSRRLQIGAPSFEEDLEPEFKIWIYLFAWWYSLPWMQKFMADLWRMLLWFSNWGGRLDERLGCGDAFCCRSCPQDCQAALTPWCFGGPSFRCPPSLRPLRGGHGASIGSRHPHWWQGGCQAMCRHDQTAPLAAVELGGSFCFDGWYQRWTMQLDDGRVNLVVQRSPRCPRSSHAPRRALCWRRAPDITSYLRRRRFRWPSSPRVCGIVFSSVGWLCRAVATTREAVDARDVE